MLFSENVITYLKITVFKQVDYSAQEQLHKYFGGLYFQKKYKDEAEKMLSSYSTVADTPEIQRIKTTQQNISAVSSHCLFPVVILK